MYGCALWPPHEVHEQEHLGAAKPVLASLIDEPIALIGIADTNGRASVISRNPVPDAAVRLHFP